MQIAAFTSHKNPQAPLANDDRIVAYAGRVFAVIDGVTAKKGPPLAGGESRGQAAGRLIEHALRELVDDGKAMTATAAQVLERIDHHFAAEYARLDMLEDARDPHLRFGAQLAAAFHDGASWRLFVVGDCGVRLNGVDVIATPNPGDGVLSLLRASVFTGALEHLAGEGTEVTDQALAVARAYDERVLELA